MGNMILFILRILDSSDNLSPQKFAGCLMIGVALFVWSIVTLWLAFSGNVFANYAEMSYGSFGIMSAGGGLLGYDLNLATKGGESKNE